MRKKLYSKRKEKGLTQEILAQKAGISRSYYNEIENNVKQGSLNAWQGIISALDIPTNELFIYLREGEIWQPKQKNIIG